MSVPYSDRISFTRVNRVMKFYHRPSVILMVSSHGKTNISKTIRSWSGNSIYAPFCARKWHNINIHIYSWSIYMGLALPEVGFFWTCSQKVTFFVIFSDNVHNDYWDAHSNGTKITEKLCLQLLYPTSPCKTNPVQIKLKCKNLARHCHLMAVPDNSPIFYISTCHDVS